MPSQDSSRAEAGPVSALVSAAAAYDRPATTRLVADLSARISRSEATIDPADLVTVLQKLRAMRWFDLLAKLLEAEFAAGVDLPVLRRHYAQALIDQGLVTAALAVLDPLVEELTPGDPEYAEARGLRARSHKQLLVATGDRARRAELSDRAVSEYLELYRLDPAKNTWHGINGVALLAHRLRIGLPVETALEPIAADVLATASSRGELGRARPWDLATAMEACLALGRNETAIDWAARYAAHPESDAFELTATLRQLIEIWELHVGEAPGDRIIPMLRAAALARAEGNRVEVGSAELTTATASDDSGFEKVLGQDGMVTYTWYRTGLVRSRSVALILDDMDEPVGTGFVLSGPSLHPDLAAHQLVLVTNHHVLGAGSVQPAEATVRFQVLADEGADRDSYRIERVLWTSPPDALDTCVATFAGDLPEVEPCPLASSVPRNDGTQRVYVIGHPQGRGLSYSIDDNVLLDYDERALHYRAPTEPGNSGSPVFNKSWKVIGLHHAGRADMPRLHGGGTYPANEGIRIDAIRAALAASPTPPPG